MEYQQYTCPKCGRIGANPVGMKHPSCDECSNVIMKPSNNGKIIGDKLVKLKPCPFCKATEKSINKDTNQPSLETWDIANADTEYQVICNDCECRGPLAVGEDNAIFLWNKR